MHGLLRRVALTACVSLAAWPAARAQATELYCLSPHQCRQPDSLSVLLRPGSNDEVLDANFGLVYQSAQGGWEYTCDDIFGGRQPYRSQAAPDGRVFVPANDGLWIGAAGCGFAKVAGDAGTQAVYDVSLDPTDPQKVWIVGGAPRWVALSTDAGKTFTTKHTFPDGLFLNHVVVAPSDPRTIYVAGFIGTTAPIVIGVSTDGGATWTVDDKVWMGVASSNQIAEFLGVAPDDPHTVYVTVTSGKGDELWKSTQGGPGLVKVLTLADQEEWPRAGFAFGATGKTVYMAGFDPLNTGMQPSASLYISHDAGANWQRRPSGDAGPRYRCLGFRAGKLYACAGEQFSGDKFFLGSSTDEGVTWSPIIRMADVVGPNACAAAKCVNTVDFLLPFQSLDGGVPARMDAAPASMPEPPAPQPMKKGGGCAFGDGANGEGLALLALGLLVARRGRA